MSAVAFLFPGQGTQFVGMGQAFLDPAGEARFARAGELLGFDLAAACWRGDPEALTATRVAQPALFVTNAVALDRLAGWGLRPQLAAGHSVGELSALYAAGVFDFETGLELTRQRADLMATIRSDGAMVACVGLDEDAVASACADARRVGVIAIGLHNAPRHYVLSGARAAVEAAAEGCRARGAVRLQWLRTQHAFHSPLMEPVRAAWREVVARVPLAPPEIPVALNSTGRLARGVADIRAALVDQIGATVRWAECVDALVRIGATTLIETGDSKVLATLARGAHRGVETFSLRDPRSRRALARRSREVDCAVP